MTAAKRYHVEAWGAADLPDLNYETDEYPEHVIRRYPCVSLSRGKVLQLAAIEAALYDGPIFDL